MKWDLREKWDHRVDLLQVSQADLLQVGQRDRDQVIQVDLHQMIWLDQADRVDQADLMDQWAGQVDLMDQADLHHLQVKELGEMDHHLQVDRDQNLIQQVDLQVDLLQVDQIWIL